MGDHYDMIGHVQSIAGGIADDQRTDTANQLPAVNPTFSWVRLAQRIPVRIHVDRLMRGTRLISGRTVTVTILSAARPPGPLSPREPAVRRSAFARRCLACDRRRLHRRAELSCARRRRCQGTSRDRPVRQQHRARLCRHAAARALVASLRRPAARCVYPGGAGGEHRSARRRRQSAPRRLCDPRGAGRAHDRHHARGPGRADAAGRDRCARRRGQQLCAGRGPHLSARSRRRHQALDRGGARRRAIGRGDARSGPRDGRGVGGAQLCRRVLGQSLDPRGRSMSSRSSGRRSTRSRGCSAAGATPRST